MPDTQLANANTPPALVSAAMGAFDMLREYFEGAIMVDADARIVWLDGRYRRLLKLDDDYDPVGRPVEDVLPHSQLRRVVKTGRPSLLDIMQFDDRQFVVCRIPLKDEAGAVKAAIGFVFYDNVDYLAPILKKVEQLQKQLSRAQAALTRERQTKYSLASFVGASEVVQELKSQIRRFALRDGPTLLLGETGTGKELLAHAIHQASDRAEGPFVAVNMAAIPEALLESEFFGVMPGAYTGAEKKPRPGKFELAHGGTLFLDEIGDMPLSIQAKFLRVLQEGEIEALGSNAVKKVDVRIIAATSQDLEQLMAERRFRSDLYYRIAVLTVNVPPLRERREDIGVICERLLETIPRAEDMADWVIRDDAVALLRRHDWPGNVRELRNTLERAAAIAPTEVLSSEIIARAMPRSPSHPPASGIDPSDLADTRARAEREAIIEAIGRAGGNKSDAARLLGISRSQFYEKLKRYDLN
ncbi:sigma 54-interacting transcriptional regulator [Pelagibacterium sp. 26DY04]|uniref:sigma-54 interaction domain-containing protein n=1 Tax=Pelagibacterium sp. 26DY04 TaxID=2967130 RepID=UPI002814F5C9|nr:sigma 54-interacting transcriptional regulator [Pelagibacterium sp. 26DY04]WMT86185.1 sigma 54-interacting transcriptional regulator [Pelagibacterium sp. 26DY04]